MRGKSKRVKNGFLDLLGLGTKTTIYHVKGSKKGGNRVSKSSWKHKGYVIYKRDDDDFEVPRMDRDSRFDSIFDAKRFIDANTGKGMISNSGMARKFRIKKGRSSVTGRVNYIVVSPDGSYKSVYDTKSRAMEDVKDYNASLASYNKQYKGRGSRKNPGGLLEGAVSEITSFIPVKGIRKNADGSISLLVDSAKKAIKPITGMLKGVGKVVNSGKVTLGNPLPSFVKEKKFKTEKQAEDWAKGLRYQNKTQVGQIYQNKNGKWVVKYKKEIYFS